jgi:tetratricopeptide (TPR) repeat protein
MMMKTTHAVALVLALAAGGGCADERHCPCPPDNVLDEQLMLLLGAARAYHHQADIYLQQGEVDKAIAAVREILQLGLDSRWPEAEEVRLDATARLAKLLLGKEAAAEALELVERGIASAKHESFYLANLHAVRGEILEQQAKELRAQGDEAAARSKAREAIQAFERSIAINKRLQKELLLEGKS